MNVSMNYGILSVQEHDVLDAMIHQECR